MFPIRIFKDQNFLFFYIVVMIIPDINDEGKKKTKKISFRHDHDARNHSFPGGKTGEKYPGNTGQRCTEGETLMPIFRRLQRLFPAPSESLLVLRFSINCQSVNPPPVGSSAGYELLALMVRNWRSDNSRMSPWGHNWWRWSQLRSWGVCGMESMVVVKGLTLMAVVVVMGGGGSSGSGSGGGDGRGVGDGVEVVVVEICD